MFYLSKTILFQVLEGPVSSLFWFVFHGTYSFTILLIFYDFWPKMYQNGWPNRGRETSKLPPKSTFDSRRSLFGPLGSPRSPKCSPGVRKSLPKCRFWSLRLRFRSRKVVSKNSVTVPSAPSMSATKTYTKAAADTQHHTTPCNQKALPGFYTVTGALVRERHEAYP